MPYWLLKTEPVEYGYEDLVKSGGGRWDGVKNRLAQNHLRRMRTGDQAFIYHTGKTRAIAGVAVVASDPYPDPDDPGFMAVDVVPRQAVAVPVTLAAIKGDPAFSGWELVRLPRLSVMPVRPEHWSRIMDMAGIRCLAPF